MSAIAEMDPTIRNAIKLMHSSGSDAAEKIRLTLDELIKTRFSSSKMLVNVLNKKHLGEENTATGSGTVTHPPHQRHRSTDSNSKSSSSKSSSSNSSVSALEVTAIPIDTPIMVELETLDEDTIMEDDQLKELEELVCVVCRQVDVSFRNRLVECADCHSLYHQECHKPQISELDANDQENSWICVLCKSKELAKPSSAPAPIVTPPPQPVASSPPHKSSSSSHKSSKSHESSSKSKSKGSSSSKTSSRESSSSSSKEERREKSSSSSSSSVTPKINIISADKRIQIMKKKAKLNEGKRKHK
uniref:Integrator complex subunit 12 n=1 Tax=Phlebotomus kandelakii TaxID=1109342 RepID=A0A6B2EDK6_9DIPT